MKILITGLEGFLGIHLAKKFLDCGYEVIGFGNLSRNTLQYFPEVKNKIQFTNADILDRKALDFALRNNIDVVIHSAAICGVSNYHTRPVDTIVTNGIGTFNIVDLCHKNQIPKVIIFSSSEVYGQHDDESEELKETDKSIFEHPSNLRQTYSLSKFFGDQLTMAYHKQYGMDICVLRPFGVFGPGQTGEGCIQIFCRKATKGEDLIIYGDGEQTRDWCYISDFVNATIKCADSNVSGEILNIGNPDTYCTINELAKTIIRISGSKSRIIYEHRNAVKDTLYRGCNINYAKSLLNWEPKINLEEGIRKTLEWYKNNSNVGEDPTI